MKGFIIFCLFFITTQVSGQRVMRGFGFVSAKEAEEFQVKGESLERAEANKNKVEANLQAAAAEIVAEEGFLQKALADIEAAKLQQEIANGLVKTAEANIQSLTINKAKEEAEANRQKKAMVTYPDCKSVIINQGVYNHCPGGYGEILIIDMVRKHKYDDVRLCQKTANIGENSECFVGYLVSGIGRKSGTSDMKSTERVTVPKKMHARMKFSNFFTPDMMITVINETTGQTIYNNSHFANGQVVELPFSETQDQVFRFLGYGRSSGLGVMLVYIDHSDPDNITRAIAEQKEREIIPKIAADITTAETNKQKEIKTIEEAGAVIKRAEQAIAAAKAAKEKAEINKEQAETDIKKAEMDLEEAQVALEEL